MHNHGRFVDTRLHRVTEMEDCAQECAKARFAAETDAPDLYKAPVRIPRQDSASTGAGVVLATMIGCLLAAALVHWWSS